MRDALNEIETIENYLLGKLSLEEELAIERKIEVDTDFARKVKEQEIIVSRIKTIDLKEQIRAAHELHVNTGNSSWLSQKGWTYLSLTFSIALISFSFWWYTTSSETEPLPQLAINESFIKPPLEGIEIPFTTRTIEVDKENTLFFESGAMLIIPAFAFENESGLEIEGEVDIKFREFMDATDIYLSGIPMDYSIGEENYQFESAAMCEILGEQDGKSLKIREGKQIDVIQSSYTTSESFNLYRFNESTGKWDEKGKDQAIDLGRDGRFLSQDEKIEVDDFNGLEEEVIEQLNIVAPRKANPKGLRFSIEYEEDEFSELESFDDVLFEIDQSASNFKTGDDNIEWEDVSISRGEKEGSYKVHFTKESTNQERTYTVYPVFEEKAYAQAKQVYDAKLRQYEQKKSSRIQQETMEERMREKKFMALERRNKYVDSMNRMVELRNVQIERQNRLMEERNRQTLAANKRIDSLNKANRERYKQKMDSLYAANVANRAKMQRINDSLNEIMTNAMASASFTIGLQRAYQIDQFGIWNSDQPVAFPSEKTVFADFQFNGEKVGKVILVDKERRALFNYYPIDYQRFSYNPNSDNVVWTVVDQKVVYFNEFDELPSDKSQLYLVDLQPLDIPTTDYNDVKRAIAAL